MLIILKSEIKPCNSWRAVERQINGITDPRLPAVRVHQLSYIAVRYWFDFHDKLTLDSSEQLRRIRDWIENSGCVSGYYYAGFDWDIPEVHYIIGFEDTNSALAFKLRWC